MASQDRGSRGESEGTRARSFSGLRLTRCAFLTAAVAIAPALLSPTPAAAGCTYNAATRVVTQTTDGFNMVLDASSTGHRIWSGFNPCVSATQQAAVGTTDLIVINQTQTFPHPSGIRIGFPGAPNSFAPGYTNEPGSSDEIEFSVNPAQGLPFSIFGSNPAGTDYGPVNVTLGGNQINLNSNEADGVDPDVTVNGPLRNPLRITGTDFEGAGPFFDDIINASGGSGTPSLSFQSPLSATGRDGHDVLVGASRKDSLKGGGGPDSLFGEGGSDKLAGTGGKDFLDGGPGHDECSGGPGNDQFKRCEVKQQ